MTHQTGWTETCQEILLKKVSWPERQVFLSCRFFPHLSFPSRTWLVTKIDKQRVKHLMVHHTIIIAYVWHWSIIAKLFTRCIFPSFFNVLFNIKTVWQKSIERNLHCSWGWLLTKLDVVWYRCESTMACSSFAESFSFSTLRMKGEKSPFWSGHMRSLQYAFKLIIKGRV